MRFLLFFFAVLIPSMGFGQTAKSGKGVDRKTLVGQKIPGYTHKKIEGFDCLVHEEVLKNNDDSKWERSPLDVLELELGTVSRVLPKKVENVLHSVVVWIEWHDTQDRDIQTSVAKYYGVSGGSRLGWSLAEKKHPGKANNVEVISMKSLTEEHQPKQKFDRCVLLHEFAHAIHFHIVGPNNPIVGQTYAKAIQRGLYDSARDVNDRVIRPYARTSEQEYFAELTCNYLNKLHYFPFTRDELKKHDADGYSMMEKTWGKPETIEKQIRQENELAAGIKLNAARKLLAEKKLADAKATLTKIMDWFPKSAAAKDAAKLLEKTNEGK
jgi:hypothetical protein